MDGVSHLCLYHLRTVVWAAVLGAYGRQPHLFHAARLFGVVRICVAAQESGGAGIYWGRGDDRGGAVSHCFGRQRWWWGR